MTSPTALPIARLRALGCKVKTTISHNGHDWTPAREKRGISHFWEYVVTLPAGVRLPADAPERSVLGKATLRKSVQSNAVVAYSYDRDAIAALLDHLADTIGGKS
jgi:hypothetical protein